MYDPISSVSKIGQISLCRLVFCARCVFSWIDFVLCILVEPESSDWCAEEESIRGRKKKKVRTPTVRKRGRGSSGSARGRGRGRVKKISSGISQPTVGGSGGDGLEVASVASSVGACGDVALAGSETEASGNVFRFRKPRSAVASR